MKKRCKNFTSNKFKMPSNLVHDALVNDPEVAATPHMSNSGLPVPRMRNKKSFFIACAMLCEADANNSKKGNRNREIFQRSPLRLACAATRRR